MIIAIILALILVLVALLVRQIAAAPLFRTLGLCFDNWGDEWRSGERPSG